ncbi:glycogenin 1, isoform CRA_c [Radiomyces spectabilis]|uniref:glycogenin 1, isoform CRA_c n=1 Tax=Radiomyces spectabilis TaxID=64574 RepID=UPI00221FC332|nr:glycogenin 1, isoform CRA_c [Radiomyces spectabilis]KAI8388409.1 glycogenin 1, isoform CRA_c [Radiomyces spectabilis]
MEAYVTLLTSDAYASGVLVLAHRLRDLGSKKDIACLVTPQVSERIRRYLETVVTVIAVDMIRSYDEANLKILGRPELDVTFTKIHVWQLHQYTKIVFLDADTLPMRNVDELFERPDFSAAPDAGWPDCFNSGVFVTAPSDSVYQDLLTLAKEKGSFDGGDQGLLNTYFSSWPSSSAHRLPFIFNTTPTTQYR